MKATAVLFGLRAEENRTFLTDKKQPEKSIFNYGHVRHNVHSKELAEKYNKEAVLQDRPSSFIEWKENPQRQGFDKPVAGKIGSYHG